LQKTTFTNTGATVRSTAFHKTGFTVTGARTTASFTGSLTWYLTADGGTNWESQSLTSGVQTVYSFTNTGSDLRWRADNTATTDQITRIDVEIIGG
jgi:hypothetical protein